MIFCISKHCLLAFPKVINMRNSKNKILIVDDEWAICEMLTERLSLQGFEVHPARNAREFQEKAFTVRPDLIILDLMLGDEMGLDAYQQILKQGFNPQVPVLMITGIADEHPPSPAAPGRTFALLKKPFKSAQLVEEVQLLIQK